MLPVERMPQPARCYGLLQLTRCSLGARIKPQLSLSLLQLFEVPGFMLSLRVRGPAACSPRRQMGLPPLLVLVRLREPLLVLIRLLLAVGASVRLATGHRPSHFRIQIGKLLGSLAS